MPTMPGTFRPSYMPPKPDADRAADRARGSAHSRGYDVRWSKASRIFLDRLVLCPACQTEGITCAAVVTDHVIPHKGDRVLFWKKSNWQGCCKWHHDAVKQRLESLYAAGKIDAASLVLTSPYALSLARRMRIGEFRGDLAGRGVG